MEKRKIGVLTLSRCGGEWCIDECDKDAIAVAIPVEIDGEPVTKIYHRAFSECACLEEVTFAEIESYLDAGVLTLEIGDYAFEECVSLKEIELPELVGCVGRGAFYGCSSLERVYVPNCYVAPYAFCRCEALVSVTPLRYISEGAFSHCRALTTLPIADGCRGIDEDAFYHCYALTEVTIPTSVERIEALAFRSCYGLRSVRFEDTVGWYATSRYRDGEFQIDVTNPEKNATDLSKMDFDDGVRGWFKRS